jgi:hypothetical protein
MSVESCIPVIPSRNLEKSWVCRWMVEDRPSLRSKTETTGKRSSFLTDDDRYSHRFGVPTEDKVLTYWMFARFCLLQGNNRDWWGLQVPLQ